MFLMSITKSPYLRECDIGLGRTMPHEKRNSGQTCIGYGMKSFRSGVGFRINVKDPAGFSFFPKLILYRDWAVQISTIIKAEMASQGESPADNAMHLRVGDELTGKVLRLEPDGRLLLDLGSFRALAHSSMAVQQGQELRLRVIKTELPLHLQVLEGRSDDSPGPPPPRLMLSDILAPAEHQRLVGIFSRLLQLQGTKAPDPSIPVDVLQAMARVNTLFDPLPLNRSIEHIIRWLRTALQDSGLFFENKLADAILQGNTPTADAALKSTSQDNLHQDAVNPGLVSGTVKKDAKGQLMILRSFLSSAPEALPPADVLPEKEVAFLRDAVQRLLSHLEEQQDRIVQRFGENNVYQLVSHWVPVESQGKPIRLKLYYPQKKNFRYGRPQKIALLLDLDRLGLVRADLAMIGRTLRIDFSVQDQRTLDAIRTQTDTVAVALQGVFDQILIDTRLAMAKIQQFETEDADATAENPNLSRMLDALEVDMEIPPEMYRAVAEVLAFVYRLNQGMDGGDR
jgi:hypothetical protein